MTAILLIVFGFKLMNLSDEPVVEPKVNEKAEEQSKAKQSIIDETKEDPEKVGLHRVKLLNLKRSRKR